jgi:phage terminase large subunit-like protein
VALYRPDTCAWCQADTWCIPRANGKPQCKACEVELYYSAFLYPPLGLKVTGWARKILRELFGTLNEEDGTRQYERAYISAAKQNGKSFLTAGLPIYHIHMHPEISPEAYGSAAAKEQAGIIFKAASQLVNANPALLSVLKIIPSSKRIIRKDLAGFYQVLSADGDVQDGIRPSLNLRDEVHRWRGAKAETLHDVTTRGQVSRTEPLDIGITTAGAEYESPLWAREYEAAKKVESGAVPVKNFYVAIFEADRKRIDKDPEYWKSREARVVANPSHEDNGGFLKDRAIARFLDDALTDPSQKPAYLRYHLNVPLKSSTEPVINMPKWQACGGFPGEKEPVDLRDWPIFDVKLLMSKWGLVDKTCFAGVDASWTQDMTAMVLGFPVNDSWTLLPFFWLPEEKIIEIERKTMVSLSHWVNQGFVTATPGNAIDLRSVKDRIRWAHQMFDLQFIAYDRTNFRVEAMKLEEEDGFVVKEVPQNFMRLNEPTKFLLSAYEDGKIRHGNHPVLNWHASCLQLKYDDKDLCQPTKPKRLKTAQRIDGMQALATMWAEARTAEETTIHYTGIRSIG